ncbi:site-specific integrase [uncultured Anaerococcus sp.]|uniref:tyrosine-type recombinase/integrase n=1 Tax=uncultured Anaerococcus sp. TaxID=293428 RepID=UPI0025F1EF45|nr:site-specific integrase [uncultured Anaerococcus sp.]
MKRDRKFANGEGSITYVKGRKSPWWARLPATYDINGKEYRPTVGFYKSRREAKKALENYIYIDDIKTFREIYEAYKKTDDFLKLSYKTKNRYEDAFLSYYPIWNKNIQEVKTMEMQRCIDQKVKEGYHEKVGGKKVRKDYSKDSISRLKHVASKIYKFAEKHELVDKDRARLLEVKGKENTKEKTIFYTQDIDKLFKSIPYNPYARHVLCMIFTGMRTSEYRNLKVKNIDFERRIVTDFGIKTDKGRKRIMFIHEKIYDILKKLAEESTTGYIVENTNINRQNKKPSHPSDNTFRKSIFNKALKKAGLKPATPIQCRYTFATIAHMSGISDIDLMDLMGHESIETTKKSYLQITDFYLYDQLQSYDFRTALKIT